MLRQVYGATVFCVFFNSVSEFLEVLVFRLFSIVGRLGEPHVGSHLVNVCKKHSLAGNVFTAKDVAWGRGATYSYNR